MTDPPRLSNPTSPVSLLLQTLGMTRDDLVKHSAQMRSFLGTEANSLRALSEQLELSTSDTRPPGRARTASISNASGHAHSVSPPATPVKAEPVEGRIPSRQMDTMQMVMERKSKQKRRERRESISHSRHERRVALPEISTPSRSGTPHTNVETPHHYKYYSDRVIGEASGSQDPFLDSRGFPQTPSRKKSRSLFRAPGTPSVIPKTPAGRHIYSFNHPSSSRASSPPSSPARIVNLVSSPGPMRLVTDDDPPEELPFTLPPGSYSQNKPDYSYAAMIGQAILASPQHRLALQDIYEYITIVYPYYKRGEQTWMNSVRHALSTMAVFRKVPRGRMEGKSLWAIWDCDLPCFEHGGFRKSLCADMVKNKPAGSSKPGPKKRGSAMMDETIARNSKRRKMKEEDTPQTFPPGMGAPMLPPFYAPIIPGSHHQPYYQPYQHYQPYYQPTEVIFPPLPAYAKLASVGAVSTTVSRSASLDASALERAPSSEPAEPPPSSESSVPDLDPNASSSSSPPLSSQCHPDTASETEAYAPHPVSMPTIFDPEDEDDGDFEEQAAFWLASDPPMETLEPSVTLLNRGHSAKEIHDRSSLSTARKRPSKALPFPEPPESPTTERRIAASAKGKQKAARRRSPSPLPRRVASSHKIPRPSTPPPRPCTPPRRHSDTLQLSPHRTPISHRGLHMSPSPSLAHYKTNLDPPPTAVFHPSAPLLCGLTTSPSLVLPNPEVMRTPSRRRTSQPSGSGSASSSFNMSSFAPVTPKRLVFPGMNIESPFRTPSSRPFFDPHDPMALLDDELNHRTSLNLESPGLFGRKGLLYESPGLPISPGQWDW